MPPKDECPCRSRRPYKACCEPFHRGAREAPDPVALMRSRFSAFARRDVEHLWRTLHSEHEDRQRPEAEVLRELRSSAGRFRYAGLSILDQRAADDDGIAQVLFLARLFEGPNDRSFVELSDFAHDGEGWRYRSGALVRVAAVKGDPEELTIAAFEALRRAR